MGLEARDLEELLQEELPLECSIYAHLIGNKFERCSEAIVLEIGSGKNAPDKFVWFANTTEVLNSQKEELEELEIDRQKWLAGTFMGSPYSWWLDDFIDEVNVAQGREKPDDSNDYSSGYSSSTSGLTSFLSLLGRASAGAYDEYDNLPHVKAAKISSVREEALSSCPRDVAEVIRKNAPTTVSIERKFNSQGDRYKCYDVDGVLLGRVFGASGHRYWKQA